MFKLICVTSRNLCRGDFQEQIEKIAKAGISAVILREKDLEETQYKELAEQVISICEANSVFCILHSFYKIAKELEQDRIHLPLAKLREHPKLAEQFGTVGVSIHSVEESIEAEQLGASYVVAGHIFATDCKSGLPPRGTAFLKEIVKAVTIPVYAIGGIQEANIISIQKAGAKGACMMSSLMTEESPGYLLKKFQNKIEKNREKDC